MSTKVDPSTLLFGIRVAKRIFTRDPGKMSVGKGKKGGGKR